METSTPTALVFPPLWKRIGAYVIDLYFIFMLAYALIIILPTPIADQFRLAIFGLAVLYEPICNSVLGYTFGSFIFKFRVRDSADTTKKLPFHRALIRFAVKTLLGWCHF